MSLQSIIPSKVLSMIKNINDTILKLTSDNQISEVKVLDELPSDAEIHTDTLYYIKQS